MASQTKTPRVREPLTIKNDHVRHTPQARKRSQQRGHLTKGQKTGNIGKRGPANDTHCIHDVTRGPRDDDNRRVHAMRIL